MHVAQRCLSRRRVTVTLSGKRRAAYPFVRRRRELRPGRCRQLNRSGNPAALMVACGLAATVVISISILAAAHHWSRQSDAEYLERFVETGATVAAIVARVAEQYIDAPERNQIELSSLADVAGQLPGARGLTITGAGRNAPRNYEHIWASSDGRYRAADGTLRYDPGRTQILDELSSEIGRIIVAVNHDAAETLAELNPQIEEVTRGIIRLLTQEQTAEQAELAELDQVFRVLYRRGSRRLAEVSRRHAGSVPPILGADPGLMEDDVLFYHPVAAFDRANDAWYAGMVRYRRSIGPLREQQRQAHAEHRRRALSIAAGALVALWALLALVWVLSRSLSRAGFTEDRL